ncbi:MAG: glycosyltransferase family 9 protein [Bacteroidetes bacterium]|nr:glycosyltransferase family 9 protein [Bacteroidota bacterium]
MKILIIQTAFIGDVILATALIEKIHQHHPSYQIDFLLAKGNEKLLEIHPFINKMLIFDKSTNKFRNLVRLIHHVRRAQYSYVINVHRYFSSGLITACSKAKFKIGFRKNPLSFLFTTKVDHPINMMLPVHEIDRNQLLIKDITDSISAKPKLYPSDSDYKNTGNSEAYVCIAPASVWFTKQLPIGKWIELINSLAAGLKIYLIGSEQDQILCHEIQKEAAHKNIDVVAGKLSLLQSAALMEKAQMNYVNDSAPLHMASAMNASVTAFFLSTVPNFGFGPLSDHSSIVESKNLLDCRPCGLHGKAACPEKHFKCADMDVNL